MHLASIEHGIIGQSPIIGGSEFLDIASTMPKRLSRLSAHPAL